MPTQQTESSLVYEVRKIEKERRANLRKLPRPESSFSSAARAVVDELHNIFQGDADFRQRLAERFRVYCQPVDREGKDGTQVLLERLFRLDIPMAFREIPPYTKECEERERKTCEQQYKYHINELVIKSLIRSRTLIELRGIFPDKILARFGETEEVKRFLELQRIYSFLTCSLDTDKTGRVVILSPVYTESSGEFPRPLNTSLAVNLHEILKNGGLSKRQRKNADASTYYGSEFKEELIGKFVSYVLSIDCNRAYSLCQHDAESEQEKEEIARRYLRKRTREVRRRILENQPRGFSELGLEHRAVMIPIIPEESNFLG